MTTKLITYQLDDNKRDYHLISEAIKEAPQWAKVMDRVWLIKTRKTASDIRTYLSSKINNKGKIFVIDLNTKSWGSLTIDKEVTNWIKENLSE